MRVVIGYFLNATYKIYVFVRSMCVCKICTSYLFGEYIYLYHSPNYKYSIFMFLRNNIFLILNNLRKILCTYIIYLVHMCIHESMCT